MGDLRDQWAAMLRQEGSVVTGEYVAMATDIWVLTLSYPFDKA